MKFLKWCFELSTRIAIQFNETYQILTMKRAQTVDQYIAETPEWAVGLSLLRELALKAGFVEAVKWGGPAYLHNGKLVVGLGAFKSYLGLWFHQGVFLSDPAGKLLAASDSTKGLRQWRFNHVDEIDPELVMSYLREARQNQEKGLTIQPARSKEVALPIEMQEAFKANPDLKEAFDKFSPACQREFAGHIAEAKREETRLNRMAKVASLIFDGKSLNEKYRPS